MKRSRLNRLEALERQRDEAGLDRPLLTFDSYCELPDDSPLIGTDTDGNPLARIDWDTLIHTERPTYDTSTVPDVIGDRLRAVEAFISQQLAERDRVNGFVQVLQPSPTDEGATHDYCNDE